MNLHYLQYFFNPTSIAVFGASDRENSVGKYVFKSLRSGDFKGDIYPVNPAHAFIDEIKCYPDLSSISHRVDLAIVATPSKTLPAIIKECGEKGTRSLVILSAGFGEIGHEGKSREQRIVELAHNLGIRIIGPNCLGIMRPSVGLNATFSKNDALDGDIALISQSGALCTAILDWARPRKIGFSTVISLGDAADTDFGDVLTFLATDPKTSSILLYVEGIRHSRNFMSGLRIAASMKPVIVVKSGRHREGSRAAISHTGAMIGADDVFSAALERAGAVRAYSIEQLFAAAEILSGRFRLRGDRLCILTNGGGPGVMATDRAVESGIKIANLTSETIKKLNDILPAPWSHNNPVDILGDATPKRYAEALEICLHDPEVDGVLVILTPQAMTDPIEAARAILSVWSNSQEKPVLTAWMGEEQVKEARDIFASESIADFSSPEAAVEAFSYLVSYYRNQQLLVQLPSSRNMDKSSDIEGARMIIESALTEGRKILDIPESRAILRAFHIPVNVAISAKNVNEALVASETVGFPVVMKIDSPAIIHKSDAGGVCLNITSPQSVRLKYNEIVDTIKQRYPDAPVRGVTIEPMIKSLHPRELLIGIVHDPVFGPVISFGAGGTSVEVTRDRSMALPPLNEFLIDRMISHTRIAQMLGNYRNMPPIPLDKLKSLLLRISELVSEVPEIQELDLNPVIADENDITVADIRIRVDFPAAGHRAYDHMSIHPYPKDLINYYQLSDGTMITIRPIKPEDAEREQNFVTHLSDDARYFRFHQAVQSLTPEMLVRFTQIDYDREMALVAVVNIDSRETQIAVARYITTPDRQGCEFAIVVADEWHGKGLGTRIMESLMNVARGRGYRWIRGSVLKENQRMIRLMNHLDFDVRPDEEDPVLLVAEREL